MITEARMSHPNWLLWRCVLAFPLVFFALQWGWDCARGGTLERWVIDDATVGSSVVAIRLLTPQVVAVSQGSHIVAPGGGINVRNGCEGTEVYFLLIAALVAYPFSGRIRLVGILSGMALVFFLNQIRLLVLFYALRNNTVLFDQIHGLWAPLVLVVCTIAFFLFLLRAEQRVRSVPV